MGPGGEGGREGRELLLNVNYLLKVAAEVGRCGGDGEAEQSWLLSLLRLIATRVCVCARICLIRLGLGACGCGGGTTSSSADGAVGPARAGAYDCRVCCTATPGGPRRNTTAAAAPYGDQEQGDDAHRLVSCEKYGFKTARQPATHLWLTTKTVS